MNTQLNQRWITLSCRVDDHYSSSPLVWPRFGLSRMISSRAVQGTVKLDTCRPEETTNGLEDERSRLTLTGSIKTRVLLRSATHEGRAKRIGS